MDGFQPTEYEPAETKASNRPTGYHNNKCNQIQTNLKTSSPPADGFSMTSFVAETDFKPLLLLTSNKSTTNS